MKASGDTVWYKHWFGTRYYTLLYGHRGDADAAVWVGTIMDKWRFDKGAKVLDLACGRGRHAAKFSDAGMMVTGIDISATSIAEAKVLAPNVEFHVADMRDPIAEQAYDGVCCLFTSLGYFEAIEDDQRVFDAVVSALKPGGRFVLDFMNSALVLRDLVAEEELERDGVHFRIERSLDGNVIVKHITATDAGGVQRFEERVQALHHDEIERMAVKAGLVIEDRTDGPVPGPFDVSRSQRFVLWARKPMS